MPTEAMIGHGTLLEIENDDPTPTFEAIAEVKDITPPSPTTDQVDVTHMQSPNRAREFISGLIDYAEASFDLNYVPGSAADLRLTELLISGDKKNVRITWPNGATMTFLAFVSGYEPSAPVGDAITATCTLKVSGPPTIVVGP